MYPLSQSPRRVRTVETQATPLHKATFLNGSVSPNSPGARADPVATHRQEVIVGRNDTTAQLQEPEGK